jgi:tetratricopeptide (TPR) repeat protein
MAKESLNSHADALKDFEGALEASGAATTDMYYRLGRSYLLNRQYERAAKAYSKVLSMDSAHGLAFANRGVALKALQNYDMAQRDFYQALKFLDTQERKDAVRDLLKETQRLSHASVLPEPLEEIRSNSSESGKAASPDKGFW